MKRKLAAALAAIIVLSAFTACSNSGETADTTTASDGATTTAADTVAPLAVPEDLSAAVATVAAEVDPDFFTVTFDQFYKEYKFYLIRNGLDETVSTNADTCKAARENIINYLTLEKLTLRIAEEMGVGESSLTQEELDSIDTEVQDSYKTWCESFKDEATAALGENPTDEEIYNKEFELFTAFMNEAGLEPEIFAQWQKSSVIQQKLYDLVVADAEVTEEEIETYLTSTIEDAKKAYESDLTTYESTYTGVWLPEGTRSVEQIFISLPDDEISEITAYRKDGDDATADSLRDEKLAAIKADADAAVAALTNGTSWDDVQATYNDDSNGNDTKYVVYPKSELISQEMIDAVMAIAEKGGNTALLPADSGYYIFHYLDDAAVDYDNVREQIKGGILSNKQATISNEKVLEWKAKYPYTINYDLLDITDPATTTTTAAETTATPETTAAETTSAE